MDIIFHGEQPTAAVPGGSSFNSIISIGRTGIPAIFIGETGDDEVGHRIANFLKENRISSEYLTMCKDVKSAVSLAFLDEKHDAHYMFYKQPPHISPDARTPEVGEGDIVQYGSYYAIAPCIRRQVKSFLEHARRQNAILYYDLNFRRTHRHELDSLLPAIHENFRLSDVVRGSADDFEIMYGMRDAEAVYHRHIAPFCPLFICTHGSEGITLCTPQGIRRFDVPPVHTVSTVGAGDNFNAGFIYGLIKYGIRHDDLPALSGELWEKLMDCGREFAANVCASVHNSIDKEFGLRMEKGLYSSKPLNTLSSSSQERATDK